MDRKISLELSPSPVDEKAEALVTDSSKASPGLKRPKLPYAWRLAMIILTCLCSCKLFILVESFSQYG